MPSFEEYAAALNARDTISGIVSDQLNRERPRYRYAYVQSIDRINRACQVQFVEGGDFVTVQMGSTQPQSTGQIVRVAGLMGDRYIDDVIGPVIIDNGPIAPNFQVMCMFIFTGARTGLSTLAWNLPVPSVNAWVGGYDQSGGGQGAWKEVDQYFQGGYWYAYSFFTKGPNVGIHQVTVDGAIAPLLQSDADGYQASTFSPGSAGHGEWILQSGMHKVRITEINKNASSSGYYGLLSYLMFFFVAPLS